MPYVESSVRTRQAVVAARAVMMREGITRLTMRAVANEADIPLGTLQYVFPNKLGLLHAVISDVVDEIADVLRDSADIDSGLGNAIGNGLRNFWSVLVIDHRDLQLLQLELVTYALRTPGLEDLPRWQYERYCQVVEDWCRRAAARADETAAVPYDQLARVLVAGIDGLIVQHVIAPDSDRASADVEALIRMITGLAAVRSAG
ncbi:MAG: TetR family transcriptional regulator [Gordonia sp.]|uniref:TetR/AcrR family transcriptional regulator n=1 Tax=Gordonia sp. (in: high G+C Gram-positive bacteria) TaxID=84139 RepID=UPI000C4C43AD|nr:TetR/AcrR family transcriptional regulator [Gordonia sp. (in: high G+C Gram-positive bacteria)]MAU80551.1 TetR family transcriptional regulator [Gordonia sp. (in: high G+C Gram-positive bacteria)]